MSSEPELHFALPIQAVLFDYGMVLSGPPNPEAWARIRSISTLDEDLLHREYWDHRHPYDRGTHTGPEFWQLIASGNHMTFTPDQVSALIDADIDLWGDLNLPMVEWAKQLQRAGIRTGILSNMPDAMEIGLIARHRWLDAFDHHTWSHALKLAKPEQAIYRHAAEGLGVDPATILFIDDRLENIEAALTFSMQAIQYLNHAQFIEEMYARGFAGLLTPAMIP